MSCANSNIVINIVIMVHYDNKYPQLWVRTHQGIQGDVI